MRKPRAPRRKLVSPRPSPKKLQSKPQPANRRKTPTPQPIVEPVVEEQSSEDDPNDSLQSESTINSSLNSEDLEEENIIANISPETENTNSHTMYTAPEHSQVRFKILNCINSIYFSPKTTQYHTTNTWNSIHIILSSIFPLLTRHNVIVKPYWYVKFIFLLWSININDSTVN